MALKFVCEGCGQYIITKFLKEGEVARCRNCGARTRVPKNAISTDEDPTFKTPVHSEANAVKKVDGRIRPFGKVLILIFITLGIYMGIFI